MNLSYAERYPAARQLVTKRATVQLSQVQKFVANSGKRRISGIASSIAPDRERDIVMPRGGRWKLPIPLLHQHSHSAPLGKVTKVEVRGDEIWFEAEVSEGIARVDEIWNLIEQGALDSLSIGFRGTEWDPLPGGGRRYSQWELLEISVVAIGMHPAAKIRNAAIVRETIQGHPGSVRLQANADAKSSLGKERERHLSNGAVSICRQPSSSPVKLIRVPSPASAYTNMIPGHPGSVRLTTQDKKRTSLNGAVRIWPNGREGTVRIRRDR